MQVFAGELAAAASLIEEAEAATQAMGSRLAPYGALQLAALRGQEAETSELITFTIGEVVPRGEGYGLTIAEWASAVLYNGLGRYDEALAAARVASEHGEDLSVSTWVPAELIEAATRSGTPELTSNAYERLSETTRASGTEWALGIEARSRALLTEGGASEDLYREAIERLSRTKVRVELARAHLLYGEWLRRERRRLDVREQLRTAHEMFATMGVEAFAERAARELRGDRRARPQTHGRDQHPAHASGGPDRAARLRWAVQPRDRRKSVHQHADRRVPHAQGLRQARHPVPQRARPCALQRVQRRPARPVGLASDVGHHDCSDCASAARSKLRVYANSARRSTPSTSTDLATVTSESSAGSRRTGLPQPDRCHARASANGTTSERLFRASPVRPVTAQMELQATYSHSIA